MKGGDDDMEIMSRDVSEDVFLDELDDDEYKRRNDAFIEAVKKHRTIQQGGLLKKKMVIKKNKKKLSENDKILMKCMKKTMKKAKKNDVCVCRYIGTKCRKCRNDYKV